MMEKLFLVLSIAAVTRANQICYGDLGCFTNRPPYSGTVERPISSLPWPPEKVGTQFLLLTRKNQDDFEVVTAGTVSSSTFSSDKPSCFLIHGFLDSGREAWIVAMCQTLLAVTDINCFSVAWGPGAHGLYIRAANNLRVVGAQLALFIDFLLDNFDHPLSGIYLIGHSLGAHVAGEAGKRRPGIARISGLDPAGPYFENTPPEVRLDPTDAKFVDVIHTDGSSLLLDLGFGGFGMLQAVGHLDFYPNGGEHMPGCGKIHLTHNIDSLVKGEEEKVLCNHKRSHQFFQKSILRPDGFIAYPAPSYSTFKKGSGFPCHNGSCANMGYHADGHTRDPTTSQTFYLNTGDDTNYLRWRYNVSVTVAGSSLILGHISVSLCGKDGCSDLYEVFSGIIRSRKTYSSFIDVAMAVEPVESMVFVWRKMTLSFVKSRLGASTVSVQCGADGSGYTFCGGGPTKEGTNQTLALCSSPPNVL